MKLGHTHAQDDGKIIHKNKYMVLISESYTYGQPVMALVRSGSCLIWSGLVWPCLVCSGPDLVWPGLVVSGLVLIWGWSGLVWPGLAWSGLVCSGLVWSDLVLLGLAWWLWSGLVKPGFDLFWSDDLICSGLVWSSLVWSGLSVLLWSSGRAPRLIGPMF